MNFTVLLLICALVCFVLAAFGVASRLNLTAFGLALVTLAKLLGAVLLLCVMPGCATYTLSGEYGFKDGSRAALSYTRYDK